jgi:hypothetical protein
MWPPGATYRPAGWARSVPHDERYGQSGGWELVRQQAFALSV